MGKIIRNGVEYSGATEDATAVNYNNSLSSLEATTVQEAIDELSAGVTYNPNNDWLYLNGIRWKRARLNDIYFIDNFDNEDWNISDNSNVIMTYDGSSLITETHIGYNHNEAFIQYKEISLLSTPYIKIEGTLKLYTQSTTGPDGSRQSKASFQISTDNGSTWTDLFSETLTVAAGKTSTSTTLSKNLSLLDYANKQVLLRFKFNYLTNTGSGWNLDLSLNNFKLSQ